MTLKNQLKGLVYSTESGKMCPECARPVKKCTCAKKKNPPKGDGIVRVSRQTKGRKGSGVSLVTGLALDDKELKRLAKQLKQKCGCGGTVKNGVIEIQGDHRQTLVETLLKLGYKAKSAGG